jgi:hypothetical protein
MTQAIEAKLRQERALLWRARNLHRQFLGDGSWAPCGVFESPEDRWIFEPRIASTGDSSPIPSFETNGIAASAETASSHSKHSAQQSQKPIDTTSKRRGSAPEEESIGTTDDVEMTSSPDGRTENEPRDSDAGQPKAPKSEEVDTFVGDLPQHLENGESSGAKVNGNKSGIIPQDGDRALDADVPMDQEKRQIGGPDQGRPKNNEGGDEDVDEDVEMQNGSPPEPPRRMTTRAQANAGQPQDHDSGRDSPSVSSETLSSLPTPHPLYLVSDLVRPDANFGLPPNEAEDTRRLLWSYVQKQEETVRGFEHMLESLLRACRMKEDVFEWCKAEGHVGELSDGEDWYDREKWGLAEGEDLKKGADEDEIEPVEESRSNKRGRGRRA